MCTVNSSTRRETLLGKSWMHTTLWFPGGSSHYRYWSAILLITPAMFTFIRAVVRPSQRVNKKPHKVWVAVQTDGTILLSADMTVPYGTICVCIYYDCQRYMKCMNQLWIWCMFNIKYSLFRQQFWWHWCCFDEEIMALFCANNVTSNIQHGVTWHYPVCLGSHSQEPKTSQWAGFTSQWRGFTGGRSRIV